MSKICKYTTQGYYCNTVETFAETELQKLEREIKELEKKTKVNLNEETEKPKTEPKKFIDKSVNNLEKSYEKSAESILADLLNL